MADMRARRGEDRRKLNPLVGCVLGYGADYEEDTNDRGGGAKRRKFFDSGRTTYEMAVMEIWSMPCTRWPRITWIWASCRRHR